jgi:hypothetical protein
LSGTLRITKVKFFAALYHAYLKLYKDRINKHLHTAGKAKSREKFQVFEMDSKSMTEEKEKIWRPL